MNSTNQAMRNDSSNWRRPLRKLAADRAAIISAFILLIYMLTILATALGILGRDWQRPVGKPYAKPCWMTETEALTEAPVFKAPVVSRGPATDEAANIRAPKDDADPLAEKLAEINRQTNSPTIQGSGVASDSLIMGGDRWGRDVWSKTLQGARVSVLVGLFAATIALTIGTFLGALAGYFGGRIDDLFEWLYNIVEAMPNILLVLALAAVLPRGTQSVIVILALTGWAAVYRLVRAEYKRHRVREYVLAADAIGVGNMGRIFRHILPNISGLLLVRASLMVISFIKSEVILSYLGFGVPVDSVSWGTMLGEAQNELINGYWWQIASASGAMAIFVGAFSQFSDSVRDALDPQSH